MFLKQTFDLTRSSRSTSSSSSCICASSRSIFSVINYRLILITISLILILPSAFPPPHSLSSSFKSPTGGSILVAANPDDEDRDSHSHSHEVSSGSNKWLSWTGITSGLTDMACFLLKNECCRPPYVRRKEAASILAKRLKSDFYGQHLATDTVITALDAHLQDPNPGKALVLSFHGWAGSGKTYLAELIIESLFKRGMNSNYYKFYLASLNFPDETKVKEYQENLRIDIKRVLRACTYSVFVFDEVDKTPPGVFDAITPFIEYPGTIDNGLDHKKAIFIFLSNTGSNDITSVSLQAWKSGKRREDLTFKDYEDKLLKEAFNNAENGLFRSRIIDRVLVDYFIPFLPMERKHILQCIGAEVRRHNDESNLDRYSEIADTLTYWPTDLKLYSISGCKRIEAAVKYKKMKEQYMKIDQEEEKELKKETDDSRSSKKSEL